MPKKSSNNLKVLHVSKSGNFRTNGGIETFVDNLCKAGAKMGIINTHLYLSPHPRKQKMQYKGYILSETKQILHFASMGFSISAFAEFSKLASEHDVIHYHFPNPLCDLLHLLVAHKKPSLVTYHADIERYRFLFKLYKPLMRKFLNSVDHIVATSPSYVATSDILQQFLTKVRVIPIGIESADYSSTTQEKLSFWRERLPEKFFLFIGSLRYYKGLKIALEAIHGTKIQLIIVGSQGIEKELHSYSAFLKLKNVKFLGNVSNDDKVAILNLCYGFILPSNLRSEAFGIALLEAAIVGKPLISCEIGTGTSFINKHNVTGLVVQSNSVSKLRDAMTLLWNDKKLADQMGRAAKKRSLEKFDINLMISEYLDLYRQLRSDLEG